MVSFKKPSKGKRRKKTRKKKVESTILQTCGLIVIALVLMYQIYLYSGAAFKNYMHPALNWTCSKIGNYSHNACESVLSYDPGAEFPEIPGVADYDYIAGYYDGAVIGAAIGADDSNPNPENIQRVEIDEAAKIQFEPRSINFQRPVKYNPTIRFNITNFAQFSSTATDIVREFDENVVGIKNKFKNDTLNDLIKDNNNQTILPSFIIIGVMKCGTGAVDRFLRYHPDLATCGETYFFSDTTYHKGLNWYMSIMPKVPKKREIQLYEKTPTYFRLPNIAQRIHDMNSTIKIVYVVCDNARRTLSRYLHLENMVMNVGKTQMGERFEDVGKNLDIFNERLNKTIDELTELFQSIKDGLDDPSSMAEFLDNLHMRYIKRQRPFNTKMYSFRESILADGLYSVYLNHYLLYFKPEQILTIDGSELTSNPGKIMKDIQNFIGVNEYIKKDNFVFDEERDLYCFQDTDTVDAEPCSIAGTKGRTTDKSLDPVVNSKLHNFFAPFNEYLAQQIRHAKFDWNF